MLQILDPDGNLKTHVGHPETKKRIVFRKTVSFDTFKDIIYIPPYNKKHMSHLWWSMRELNQIQFQAKQEVIYIMKTSMTNEGVKGALRTLCESNEL